MPEQNLAMTKVAESGAPGVDAPAEPEAHSLPAVIEHAPARPERRRRPRFALLLALLTVTAGTGIGWLWWQQHQPRLPPGFASGNGRLEADEVDIDTKFAGRIAKLLVDEGDIVKPGQVVAVMDTKDLEAQLKQYQQVVLQAQHTLDQAKANYAQQQAVVKFDQQEVERELSGAPGPRHTGDA